MCCVKLKNRADVTKIASVAGTCTKDRRDLIREGKMRIKNETKVASRGLRRGRMTITDNK